ncbi:ABC transporter ATP-binding protein [Pelagibacterium halotolerans]|uniref:ABC transporter ATP-binding protein n=1 Tax=Pelagibacterium halotolerans TaxID=531813 RepID=UPI00384A6714
MIEVGDLTFTYPSARRSSAVEPTLKGLTFSIAEGEIFGFLGPSGAGKSTTQNILIRLLRGYAGSARVMGRELSAWTPDYYAHIGVSFELPNHYLKLTARENLTYFAALYGNTVHDPEAVLDWVGLANSADKRVSDFSKGMKIRLNLARSIVHRPRILFLDEPTSGLDPVNSERIRQLVLRLAHEGTTVFVTTHNMQLADRLCDRVAFVADGRISAIDAPGALKKKYGRRVVRVEHSNGGDIHAEEFPLDALGSNARFQELIANGPSIQSIHSEEATLDAIFIDVTGQELTA